MVDITRIKDLDTNATPTPGLFVPVDLSSTGKISIQTLVDTVLPAASQAEAEAGVQATKKMTPLTTAQAIAVLAATKTQGALADTAVQPADLAQVATTGNSDDLAEGVSKQFFTTQRVRETLLSGVSFATSANITETDSFLVALGKLQAQSSLKFDKAGGTVAGNVTIQPSGAGDRGVILKTASGNGFGWYVQNDGQLMLHNFDSSGAYQSTPMSVSDLGIPSFNARPLFGGSGLATLASPAFTGTPTAPTASLGTNTDQIATMAALKAAVDTRASFLSQTMLVNGVVFVLSNVSGDAAANQTILNAAVAAVSGPIRIEFMSGIFYLQKIPKLSNRHVKIKGQGWGQTILVFSNTATPDIEISQDSLIYDVDVTGFQFLRSGVANTLSCVSITRPVAASGAEYRGPNVTDNFFHGHDSNGWQVHINMVEGWNFLVTRNHFKGSDTTLVGQGIRLTGASTDGTVRDNRGTALDYGVFSPSGSFSEGCVIDGNKWVGVNYGAVFENGSNAPGGQFTNNHVAAFKAGITIVARPQWQISGNLIYRQQAAPAGWLGVYVGAACADSIVEGNVIISPVANSVAGDTAIYSVSTGDVHTTNNIARNLYTAIDYGGTGTGLISMNTYKGHTVGIGGAGSATVINNYAIAG